MKFFKKLVYCLTLLIFINACSNGGQGNLDPSDNPSNNPINTNTVAGGFEHPWMIIRSKEDLPRLQSWAVPSNPMWQAIQDIKNGYNGKKGTDYYVINLAHFDTDNPQVETNEYNPKCGFPPTVYCDGGGAKGGANLTEQYALFYAFLSLMEKGDTPESQERKDSYGKLSRNIFMWLIHEVQKGIVSDQKYVPFRNRIFFRYNRATEHGEAYGLTIDWNYKYFSQQDLNDIHTVLLQAEDILVKDGLGSSLWLDLGSNNPVGGDANKIINLGNDKIVNVKPAWRWAAENYPAGSNKDILFNILALKGAPVSSVPGLGTLWDSIDQYTQFLEGGVQLRNEGFFAKGEGNGGLMPEGPYGYGLLTSGALATYRLGAMSAQLVNLYSFPSGINSYLDSNFWDHLLDGIISGMANTPIGSNANYPGSGKRYLTATYNQSSSASLGALVSNVAGAMAVFDYYFKDDPEHYKRYLKELWLMANGPIGGAEKIYERVRQDGIGPSGGLNAFSTLLYFLAFDPAINPKDPSALPDPRPSLPLNFWDPAQGRAISRSSWSEDGSWFGSLCAYSTLDHVTGENGSFFLNVGGSFVTHSTSGYTTTMEIDKPQYNNTLGLQNLGDPKITLYPAVFSEGGQQYGYTAGDPEAEVSFADQFTFTHCDMTNVYNKANSAANAVTHASRSLVWVKPSAPSSSNYVVIYDRASTNAPNLFKRFYLIFYPNNNPGVQSKTLTGFTADNKVKYFLQTLLPNAPTTTVILNQMPGETGASRAVDDSMVKADPNAIQPAVWGQSLKVEDTSNPKDVHFLHVLQAAPGTPNQVVPVLVSSQYFTGARIGNLVVLFRKDITIPAPLSFSFNSGVIAQSYVITGLLPHMAYHYLVQGASVQVSSSFFAGASLADADAAGIIQIGNIVSP